MHTAYLVVTVLLVGLLAFSATADYVRYSRVLTAMARAGVPESWLPALATLKAAGAAGLLVGIAIPAIGLAAAVGVTLFFVGAFVAHVRARWFSVAPVPYFVLAIGSLALTLLTYSTGQAGRWSWRAGRPRPPHHSQGIVTRQQLKGLA
jgi:DoxX-like family